MSKRRHSAIRGFTLLEMMVVIAAGSLVMGTAVAALGLLLQSQTVHRDQENFSAARFRLACQFRDDVRSATTWHIEDQEGFGWTSQLRSGVEVRYEFDEIAVIRVATKAGTVIARERYRQPLGTTVSLRKLPSDGRTTPLIEMRIEPPAGLGHRGDHRVVARASADTRFERKKSP